MPAQMEVPEMKIISSGLSYLGAVSPQVAAGFVEEGGFDFAGYGRTIFAYPDFARDILSGKGMNKNISVRVCEKSKL